MRDLYVEIIGQVQADNTIKMFTALNLGDNIGEHVYHSSPACILIGGCRSSRREPYDRTYAYPRHGSLLVHKTVLNALNLLTAGFTHCILGSISDCTRTRSPSAFSQCNLIASCVFY